MVLIIASALKAGQTDMVLRPIATTMALSEDVGIQLEFLREAPWELVRALSAVRVEQ